MSALRLVAVFLLAIVVAPILFAPAEATPPKAWRLLFTFEDPAPGLHEETFTISPKQDYARFVFMAHDSAPTAGVAAGVVAFQVNRAGLAEVTCRGTTSVVFIFEQIPFCDGLRPNHSYRVVYSASTPDVHLRLFGFD